MTFIRHHPSAPLDVFVECLWWSRRDDPQSFCEHMLPNGSAQLIFALHETPIICRPTSASVNAVSWSRGVVHGPQWKYFISGPKPRGAVVGVSFRPGAAGAILGVPIADLADCHVTVDALWGNRGQEIRELLIAAHSPTEVFRILERELVKRITRPLLIHPAVAHALTPRSSVWSAVRVGHVQREAGYSSKHFIELFRSAVGLTPKHYYRVKRFTTVLEHLANSRAANLAELATSAGYADQSHLTREFRDFAGVTPTEYRPRPSYGVHHHQVPENAKSRPR